MAYSKKVVEKFENTLNEPEKNSVGRWDPVSYTHLTLPTKA